MLSILIPVYNYNIVTLVTQLYCQCAIISDFKFEILVFDDHSQLFHKENNYVNTLKNCTYTILERNIGRSAIRNLLAQNANYENLLFLDADVQIISDTFILTYLDFINQKKYEVVYGGIVYQSEKPNKNQRLRWIYGNKRESLTAKKRSEQRYLSFLTLNFLIKKEVFKQVCFNENIPNLRYEDLLFSYDLMQAKISVAHIDNQVVHNGIETSAIFLSKTEDSLNGLKYLLENRILPYDYARITKTYHYLKQRKLLYFIVSFYKITRSFLKYNLVSKTPSLFIYDIYRLGYFSTITK